MVPRSQAHSRARHTGGLLTVAILLIISMVSGCSTSLDEGDGKTTTDIADVDVTGKQGAKPAIDVHAPFSTTKMARRILVTGKGDVVKPGVRVTVDYLAVNGTDNRQFSSTWGLESATFTLDDERNIKGLVEGLTGVTVGSRVLITVPPADGYGTNGNAALGIGPTDSLVFVVDVNEAKKVLARATGRKVDPKSGLPKVKLDSKTGEPTITIPTSKAPDKLGIQPLIQGSGPKVKKGETITVHYKAVVWPGGKEFDTTWKQDSPATFQIGVGDVLAGWDDGLIGQRVGSQVMLILPPDKAFGIAGKPEKGVKGTDTVVFVIDILDTAEATTAP